MSLTDSLQAPLEPISPSFALLPLELKLKILSHTYDKPRIIEIKLVHNEAGQGSFRALSTFVRLGPTALRVCRESRRQAQTSYVRIGSLGWMDFNKDTIYLGKGNSWRSIQLFTYWWRKEVLKNLRFYSIHFDADFLSWLEQLVYMIQKDRCPKLERFDLVMYEVPLPDSEAWRPQHAERAVLQFTELAHTGDGPDLENSIGVSARMAQITNRYNHTYNDLARRGDVYENPPQFVYSYLNRVLDE